MKSEEYYCDVKGCGVSVTKDELKGKYIQVIFTTEQTEGRSVQRYLSNETIDICEGCMKRILNGEYLYGSGAQGFNQYWFGDKLFTVDELEKAYNKSWAPWGGGFNPEVYFKILREFVNRLTIIRINKL